MQNAGMDESQAGIKIAGRNINNLSYADDTTVMAENEKQLKWNLALIYLYPTRKLADGWSGEAQFIQRYIK